MSWPAYYGNLPRFYGSIAFASALASAHTRRQSDCSNQAAHGQISIRWRTLMSNISRCRRPHDPNAVWAETEQPAVAPAPDPAVATVDSAELSAAELAQLWGVTLRALRFYEARGLISPRRE